MSLLLEISHCPIAKLLIEPQSLDTPCREIVESQAVETIDDFQLPEPWSGQISSAPVLFLSSNPSISPTEQYPTWSWSDEMVGDYFENRFVGGKKQWIRDGRYGLQKDSTYSKAVAFWASVRKRAEELYTREVVPGVDYALSEVVHCKSRQEIGVRKAASFCSERYLDKIFEISNAVIIVALGDIAKVAIKAMYNVADDASPMLESVIMGGRERAVVFLPHPNARKKRTLRSVLTVSELNKLRFTLDNYVRNNPVHTGSVLG